MSNSASHVSSWLALRPHCLFRAEVMNIKASGNKIPNIVATDKGAVLVPVLGFEGSSNSISGWYLPLP